MKILFEDEHLFAVAKPGGLLTVPGRTPEKADSLISRLKAERGEDQVLLVHRLDRDTSGLILFAKTRDAQKGLGLRFERRQVEKEYHALVHGAVQGEEGWIHAPLKKDWTRNDPPVYIVDTEKGKAASTYWQVMGRFASCTVLRLLPETGRSHQLRVHCQFCGHPIVGDLIYAADVQEDMEIPPGRWALPGASLCLTAVRLRFRHPVEAEWVEICLPDIQSDDSDPILFG